MTSIVGILCQTGVVLGTDSSATFGSGRIRTIEQPTQKLKIIGDSIILAGTGQVGLGQRFQAIVEKSWQDGIFKKTAMEITKYLSKVTIEDFAYTHAPKEGYGALLAFPAEKTFHLCEFTVADFQPELKTKELWYVSLGVTIQITDSFLALMREVLWKTGPPPLSGGEFVATWTLDHAIEVNVGGVKGPIQLAVLGPDNKGQLRAKQLSEVYLGEHMQNIEGAKVALLDYCSSLQKPKDEETPDIPRPTNG
jgi:hypothetical protein